MCIVLFSFLGFSALVCTFVARISPRGADEGCCAVQREYEEFKVRINALVAKAQVKPAAGWQMADGTPWPGNIRSDHVGMIQVSRLPMPYAKWWGGLWAQRRQCQACCSRPC